MSAGHDDEPRRSLWGSRVRVGGGGSRGNEFWPRQLPLPTELWALTTSCRYSCNNAAVCDYVSALALGLVCGITSSRVPWEHRVTFNHVWGQGGGGGGFQQSHMKCTAQSHACWLVGETILKNINFIDIFSPSMLPLWFDMQFFCLFFKVFFMCIFLPNTINESVLQ